MSALLESLENRGVRLYISGDKLKFSAKNGINSETAALIRKNKPALIAELKGDTDAIHAELPPDFTDSAAAYDALLYWLLAGVRFYLNDANCCQPTIPDSVLAYLTEPGADQIDALCIHRGVWAAAARILRTESDGINFVSLQWD